MAEQYERIFSGLLTVHAFSIEKQNTFFHSEAKYFKYRLKRVHSTECEAYLFSNQIFF